MKAYTVMECFIMLSYLLVLANVTQTLLIISGVELNPGPFDIGKNHFINILTNWKINEKYKSHLIVFSIHILMLYKMRAKAHVK